MRTLHEVDAKRWIHNHRNFDDSNIDGTIAYIDYAFVAPDYHGLGVGKKLYTEIPVGNTVKAV